MVIQLINRHSQNGNPVSFIFKSVLSPALVLCLLQSAQTSFFTAQLWTLQVWGGAGGSTGHQSTCSQVLPTLRSMECTENGNGGPQGPQTMGGAGSPASGSRMSAKAGATEEAWVTRYQWEIWFPGLQVHVSLYTLQSTFPLHFLVASLIFKWETPSLNDLLAEICGC